MIITDDEVDLIAPLLGAPADNEVLDRCLYIGFLSFLVQKQAPRGYILCRELPGPSGDDYVVIRDADGHYHIIKQQMSYQMAQLLDNILLFYL